VLNTEHISTLC